MNKLFVRLVASGAIATSMGATALADSVSIDTTGPGSTNTVTSRSWNSFETNVCNWAELGNWNMQHARSGNVLAKHNTSLGGFGGSGWAANENSGQNNVHIVNNGPSWDWGNGSSSDNHASIFLTGPDSRNRISFNDSNRFNSNTTNNVQATNFNDQSARSGSVTISGNTVVGNVGGSGNASNENSGVNNVSLTNSSGFGGTTWGSGGSNDASISTTGPGSSNRISFNNNTSTNMNTQNHVNATNADYQTARSGDVTISHNTRVGGVGGSGWAGNSNSGYNTVNIANE